MELLYHAEDDQELGYIDRSDRTPPATMGNKYRLYDTAAVENRSIVNVALNKNNADQFQSANTNTRPIDVILNTADRFQSANNFARPVDVAKNTADRSQSANNSARPVDVVKNTADRLQSANVVHVAKTKKLGKRKSNGSSEAGPVEDPTRGPPSAPGTPVTLMGTPEAQRLIDKNAKQIEISQQYQGRCSKWMRRYSDLGTVIRKINDVTYEIHCKQWRKNPTRIFHVDKLKRKENFVLQGEIPEEAV